MTDQKHDGRAISLLSVVVIVLLTIIGMLSTQIAIEYFHGERREAPLVPPSKAVKTERLSMETQYEVAIHESGHAILGHLLIPDRPIERMWLYAERPDDTYYLGMTEAGDPVAKYAPEVWDRAAAIFFLGGLASEQVFLGKKPPDEYEDKDVAGEEMLDYCEKVGCACPPDSKFGDQCLLKDMMRAERERQYAEAVRCLEANKEQVVALANLLFRKGVETVPPEVVLAGFSGGSWRKLDAKELKSFFDAHPLAPCPGKNKDATAP